MKRTPGPSRDGRRGGRFQGSAEAFGTWAVSVQEIFKVLFVMGRLVPITFPDDAANRAATCLDSLPPDLVLRVLLAGAPPPRIRCFQGRGAQWSPAEPGSPYFHCRSMFMSREVKNNHGNWVRAKLSAAPLESAPKLPGRAGRAPRRAAGTRWARGSPGGTLGGCTVNTCS